MKKTFRNLEVLEKRFSKSLRNHVKQAKSLSDLNNTFSQTMSQFLNEALGTNFHVSIQDIRFDPENSVHMNLSKRLEHSKQFLETWGHSNLPGYLYKAADVTWHQYRHLRQHPEKTKVKIRQSNNLMHP